MIDLKSLFAKNLKKYYGKDSNLVKALNDVSLEIEPGKYGGRGDKWIWEKYFTTLLSWIR